MVYGELFEEIERTSSVSFLISSAVSTSFGQLPKFQASWMCSFSTLRYFLKSEDHREIFPPPIDAGRSMCTPGRRWLHPTGTSPLPYGQVHDQRLQLRRRETVVFPDG